MANFKNLPSGNQKGKTLYNAGIVKGIVALAVSEVGGVAIDSKRKEEKRCYDGIRLDFNKNGIDVDVNINVYYGFNVPDVAFNIQQNIKHCVESMSEYKIHSCDVHVLSVIFDNKDIAD